MHEETQCDLSWVLSLRLACLAAWFMVFLINMTELHVNCITPEVSLMIIISYEFFTIMVSLFFVPLNHVFCYSLLVKLFITASSIHSNHLLIW